MKSELTAERLRELLDYSPGTGRFYWRVSRGAAAAGFEAGTYHCNGYRTITVDHRIFLAHRLAWLHVYGKHPCGHIDHLNNKRGDNRIENLCDRPPRDNLCRRACRSKSGIKGVSFRGSTWRVHIWANGKQIHLGAFATRREARAAYRGAALVLHGDLAVTRGRRARTRRQLARTPGRRGRTRRRSSR
jgi:HNH endonuclease